jgi:membrane complex biogenesis BtpA family protein
VTGILSMIASGRKPVIGMIQLGPLPGSSRYRGGTIGPLLDAAIAEVELLAANGIDALMVQNLGDLPVADRAIGTQVAWMTRIVSEVRHRFTGPLGLNLLENDAEAMIAVASAASADFVRIKVLVGAMMTPFGVQTAQAFAAIRARNACDAADIAIFADVHDRTGNPVVTGGLAEDLDFAVRLGGADGLVLTGKSWRQTLDFVATARERLGAVPILIGGGVTETNFAEAVAGADGVIVSSSLKDSADAFGGFVPSKVKAFMQAAERVRSPHRAGAKKKGK